MRVQGARLFGITLLVAAALLSQVTPATAVGGTCSYCRGNFESCMQSRYNSNGGYVTPQDEELCGDFSAGCWATCQSTIPTMCTYSYDFYGCGSWVYGASWGTHYEASHYCSQSYNDYYLIRTTTTCY